MVLEDPTRVSAEPAKGREKRDGEKYDGEQDEQGSDGEFQNMIEAMAIDGRASLHTSHRQLKQWAREVNAAELAPSAREPLKWSRMPIIFNMSIIQTAPLR
jgi:hypothetical protein